MQKCSEKQGAAKESVVHYQIGKVKKGVTVSFLCFINSNLGFPSLFEKN